jgi:diaminopimelate epimerase
MMGLRFARMHGCGNDFVVIDDRDGRWHARRADLAREICDRRHGIGGDGLILLEAPDGTADFRMAADFRMTYVNRTGMDGEMCGNGARCAILRAAELGIAARSAPIAMATDAGLIRAAISGSTVTLAMTDPIDERPPVLLDVGGRSFDFHYIDTGVPHAVAFLADLADLESLDLATVGPLVRHHPAFAPRGVNANFAARRPDGSLRMRTYERGVEMETLACGTGAVAVGLMAHRRFNKSAPVLIHPTGRGLIEIGFESAGDVFRNATLKGPAETIAEGEIPEAWLAVRGLVAEAFSAASAG